MPLSDFIVADLGHSRAKWGRCTTEGVAEIANLPLYDVAAWERQAQDWPTAARGTWIVAATNPLALERMKAWLTVRDLDFRLLTTFEQFGLQTVLELPAQTGKDRLANALAFRELRQPRTRRPGVLVSAGSCVTVDVVDANGVFRGGAILPGWEMMAKAANYYTTRLPLVQPPKDIPTAEGADTQSALQLGISAAVVGAIGQLEAQYRNRYEDATVHITGGGAEWLRPQFPTAEIWPAMTLEGLRLAGQRLT